MRSKEDCQNLISSYKIMKGSQVFRQTMWRLQKYKLEVLIISWGRLWLQVRLHSILYILDKMVANWAFFFNAIALNSSFASSALGSGNPTIRVRRATALGVYSWGSVFDASFLTGVLNLTSHTWNQKPHTQKRKKRKNLIISNVLKKKSTSLRKIFYSEDREVAESSKSAPFYDYTGRSKRKKKKTIV